MTNAETIVITAAEARPGDVIIDGPHGERREVIGAFRPDWQDFIEPVRSLSHMEDGREMDFYYALDAKLSVLRAV